MKKTKVFWAIGAALLIIIAIITIAFFSTPTEGLVAMASLIGLPIVNTATSMDGEMSGLNREDISKSVTQMMPSRTPLDTILRRMKKAQKAHSQKIGYYQASYKPIKDTLDATATDNGLSQSAPASKHSNAVTVEKSSIFIKVSDPAMWRTNDTILMRDLTLQGTPDKPISSGSTTFVADVMFYVNTKSNAVLELIPIGGMKGKEGASLNGKYVVPNFDASTILYRMGQAKSELAIMTEPFSIYPAVNWQYCQNFMAQIEESTFQRLTQKEVSWGFSNFEAVNIMSMKMEMELSMLFGSQGEHVVGNDRTFFTRGIVRDIDQVLEYGSGNGDTTITKEQYNNWLKRVFDGNNGSSTRVLFAGSGLIKSLSLVDEFQKSILSVEKDAHLGIDIRKIQTYFGTLDIVLAPLFKEIGWEDNGLILDMEHITKHEFVPMSVTDLDLKRSGNKNADARIIQEVSCLTLRYPDCHAIIKPTK